MWTFSIYLEAVAIVPQLILLQRYGEVENLTSNYVVLLGAYRGFYILNWVYRAAMEETYHTIWLMFIAGIVQTALYVDFFYYYAMRYVVYGRSTLMYCPVARLSTIERNGAPLLGRLTTHIVLASTMGRKCRCQSRQEDCVAAAYSFICSYPIAASLESS